jgi:hypothetical protein
LAFLIRALHVLVLVLVLLVESSKTAAPARDDDRVLDVRTASS